MEDVHDYEQQIYSHLDALTGDIDAFVAEERSQRWRSQGYEHPHIASLGEGRILFGFGLHLDDLNPCFTAIVDAGMVEAVGVRMTTFYLADYHDYQPEGEEEGEVAAREALGACAYACEWLADVRERIQTQHVQALD